MINIIIEDSIKEKCPALELVCIDCNVIVTEEYPDLLKLIKEETTKLQATLAIPDISQLPVIQASRKGYKAVGKDPARYRLSAESLLRRVVQGKGLYKINNVVDLLNLVSIQSAYSIGGYDVDKIEGTIRLGIGEDNEPYEGIGRGALNIANLPILRDDIGAFGSPTSDSTRTKVSVGTQHFLMVFFNFDGNKNASEAAVKAIELLQAYAHVQLSKTSTIK